MSGLNLFDSLERQCVCIYLRGCVSKGWQHSGLSKPSVSVCSFVRE